MALDQLLKEFSPYAAPTNEGSEAFIEVIKRLTPHALSNLAWPKNTEIA